MKRKGLLIFVIVGALVVGGMAYYLASNPGAQKAKESNTVKTFKETTGPINPLTGATEEEGFDPDALNRRVAAIVVENSQEARPQWGMDDPDYSPDIILQGEVEGGITRTLWLYADYTKVPDIIGPMRSARPPYIKFSELFDSIFIHWGASHSKGQYVGANKIFKWDKVDHIDQLTFDDTVGLYDRNHTRAVAMEHTGMIYGDKIPAAIEKEGFRTEPKKCTKLKFSKLSWLLRVPDAENISVTYSERTSWEPTVWTYDADDEKYHTNNFQNSVTRDNLLILFDETEYIDKYGYRGEAGASVTYCNYALGGGKGVLITKGNSRDIEWKVDKKKKKLILTDLEATKAAQERADAAAAEEGAEAEEVEPVRVNAKLYPGKTWIGWVSSNNGGHVEITSQTLGSEKKMS